MNANGSERGNWTKLGFIFAATGSAIGLGNIWKFPYITYENNGGAFVLVYLICIAAIGLPIMIAEMILGRKSQRNAVGAFKAVGGGKWKIVGGLGVITGFVLLSYYSVVAGWTLEYFIKSVTGAFDGMDESEVGKLFGDFLKNPVKQISWHAVFMGLTITIVAGGIVKGIQRITKILMPVLFIIMAILLIQSVFSEGFGQALTFLFRPNFSELTLGSVLEAVGHSFFTLSLGMGAIITYGSYMTDKDSIPKSAIIVCGLDTFVALMACMIIYPIIFTFKISPESMTKSAGILFSTLPIHFLNMPGGFLFGPLFFILVAFAALTSTISLLEVVVAYFIDELGWRRVQATIGLGIVIFVLGIFSALSNGAVPALSSFNLIGKSSTAGFFNTLDYLVSNWLLPVGGFFIAVFVGWRLQVAVKDEEYYKGEKTFLNYRAWNFLIKFVAPVAVAIIIIAVIFGREF
ncbi:sodium-dependent transporter [candidate division KSB1 bacterium]|nr:sodium-dependent transporter [candidate division KSB1 bacterium]